VLVWLVCGDELGAGFVVVGAEGEKLDRLQETISTCGFQANSLELADDVLRGGFETRCAGKATLELIVGQILHMRPPRGAGRVPIGFGGRGKGCLSEERDREENNRQGPQQLHESSGEIEDEQNHTPAWLDESRPEF